MPTSFRIESANVLLRDEIATIINRGLEIDNCIVTIIKADMSRDLKFLKVFFSVLPEDQTEKVEKILRGQRFFIKRELAKKIKMKYIPEITFFADLGQKNAILVEKLLKKI